MSHEKVIEALYRSIQLDPHTLTDDTARVTIHQNQVLGAHLVPGLQVEPQERPDGIEARIAVTRGVRIAKPVHLCFGMLPERGVQHIVLDIRMEAGAEASLIAHCTFPNAVDVRHEMDARITLEKDATYSYFERHVHGPQGGVLVLPRAKVAVGEDARFKTEFVLISGRVGRLEIDYEILCQARSVMELTARASGRGTDYLQLNETARLLGAGARGVLTTHIAVRDEAQAHVHNTLTAHAPDTRGHVDCKEIVQGRAVATALPEVAHWSYHRSTWSQLPALSEAAAPTATTDAP